MVGSQLVHGFGKLIDARAMRLDGMRGAGCLGNLFLADVHADIFEEHLSHSGTAMVFGNLLDAPQTAKFLWVVWGI